MFWASRITLAPAPQPAKGTLTRLTSQNTADAQFLHQKIEYLAALTRLRQICCTPELYLDNYEDGSGKEDACMELLVEGSESGRKTLVFSQFTGMLELLIERAEKLGLSWLYLSGKNTSEQRRLCDIRQSGTAAAFTERKYIISGINTQSFCTVR